MLKIFSRLKITSELHTINKDSSGWVDIDEFFSPKYANQLNANQLKEYLIKTFGPDYENYFWQDGENNLTRKLEQKLSQLPRIPTPKHFGNNLVDCRVWTYHSKDSSKEFYLLQFDEPKTPPTKMLLGRPEDLEFLK